ncbi:uncharacterized protein LOC121972380 [Zingiber officinale]|uniref:uncharacterized protein LOC121972380 n=1 Tax=Zingiber officinale TaxID=94328 RepID=UPI001C4AA7DD|nr:uncharacterized protein LOC121972380 [Zingiber officinale]
MEIYPLPQINQMVDSTASCELISMLDAYQGYHQVLLAKEDQKKISSQPFHQIWIDQDRRIKSGEIKSPKLSHSVWQQPDHCARFFLATELGHRRPAATSPDSLPPAGACPSPLAGISYPQPHFLFGISSGVRARAATTASHSRRQASAPIIHLTGGVLRFDVFHNIVVAEYFHWNMLRNLAGIYYEQSQLDMAILHYKQAINCDSTFIEAYNNLGNALKDAGHVEEAINFYRSCLALQPNHPQALSSLGNIYMDCNMMSVAASFYKATLAVTIGISVPFNNLAIIYKQQGTYAEAIACYNEVLRRLLLMVLSIEGTHLRRLVELLKQFRIIYVL